MKKLSLLLIIVGSISCSTVEILPGLCYNDKDKSHLCEEQNDSWETCKPFMHDGETWSNCMMIA